MPNAGHLVSQLRLRVKRDFGICEEFPYVSLLLWALFHGSTKPAERINREVSVPVRSRSPTCKEGKVAVPQSRAGRNPALALITWLD